MGHRSEIMWIERKTDGLVGPARIGRVTYSKSGRSLSYGEQRFESLKRKGFKANYLDLATGDQYWISGLPQGWEGRPLLHDRRDRRRRQAGVLDENSQPAREQSHFKAQGQRQVPGIGAWQA